jgi:hypothetical protein
MSLVTRTPLALEISHRDLTNRVNLSLDSSFGCSSFPSKSLLHVPCSTGRVVPSAYDRPVMLAMPFCSDFDAAGVLSLPAVLPR